MCAAGTRSRPNPPGDVRQVTPPVIKDGEPTLMPCWGHLFFHFCRTGRCGARFHPTVDMLRTRSRNVMAPL
ncbi:hypothetical protein FrEUN1fDRAFT_1320 [Parafrankia sp. EUN1f]|nr:hypothetical protein FrEUN1fDRAFT_1320 [Parafrankia sp. EUN1f]